MKARRESLMNNAGQHWILTQYFERRPPLSSLFSTVAGGNARNRAHCIRHISEEIFVPQRGSEPSRASARLKLLKAAAKSPRSLDAMPK
jgi:hypothetical protein